MDARTRKRVNREARRDRVKRARELWSEEEFGLSLQQRRGGTRVVWNVDRDPAIALMGLSRLRTVVLDGLELELVTSLRFAGESWEDIGWYLGVSGEAARKRLAGPVAALEEEFAKTGTSRDPLPDDGPVG